MDIKRSTNKLARVLWNEWHLFILMSKNYSRLLDQVLYLVPQLLFRKHNIAVRAAGSIAWPLSSRLGQLTLLWWIIQAWPPRGAKNLPFLQGDLIKETLQLDSFYQNVRLFKCQQLSINCETRYSWEDWWQWLPPLLVSWAFSSKWCHGNWWMGAWGSFPATNTVKMVSAPCGYDLLGGTELNLVTSGWLFLFRFIVLV